MAAPATHIIFADAFLQTAPQFSPAEFIIGSIFPDIRHLGSLTREQTHIKPYDLVSIHNERDSFLAGVKFHNYTDITRTQFWQQSAIFEYLPKSPRIQMVLKIQEDIVLYRRVKNWNRIISYFKYYIAQEQDFGAPLGDIRMWHHMLTGYLSSQPTLEKALQFKSGFKAKLDQNDIVEIEQALRDTQATPDINQAITELYRALADNFASAGHHSQKTGQPLLNLLE